MKVIKSISKMQYVSDKIKLKNKTIGFVPTMGALHKGHIALIDKARKENDIVVVSIFVNPLQFGPKEDFKKYPRPIKKDLRICNQHKVDYVFYPTIKEIYPEGKILTYVQPDEKLTNILCGKYRPGHFTGVATVVTKLFNIVKPHRAYFGEKDYQQLKIIQQMVKDLNLDINIIPCDTVRENHGLASSSRNLYLRKDAYEKANSLYKSLEYCKQLILSRKYKKKECIKLSKKYLSELLSPLEYKIQYFEIYDKDLNPVKENISSLPKGTELRIFVAAYVEGTRLIDNIPVKL